MSRNAERLKRLREMLGDALFSEVCSTFDGEILYIALRGDKAERNAAIRLDFYRGAAADELAEKYGLSISQICKIVNG